MPELVRILSAETGLTHEESSELVHAIKVLRDGFQEQIDSVINVLMIRYPPRTGSVQEWKEA